MNLRQRLTVALELAETRKLQEDWSSYKLLLKGPKGSFWLISNAPDELQKAFLDLDRKQQQAVMDLVAAYRDRAKSADELHQVLAAAIKRVGEEQKSVSKLETSKLLQRMAG